MLLPAPFLHFAKIYEEHGFSLWMIGGTSRDLLLGIDPLDFDFVTDATPEEEKAFLPEADFTFARFGSIKIKFEGREVDITTLRKEGDYKDSRHPSSILFIKEISVDSLRRDFTVNALYIDPKGDVFDFHNGQEDLKNHQIRFIGDPEKRIQEDPLRILRAERFAKRLGFSLEANTAKALEQLRPLLSKINPEKVKMEQKKE